MRNSDDDYGMSTGRDLDRETRMLDRYISRQQWAPCWRCRGTGNVVRVMPYDALAGSSRFVKVTCPACQGTGRDT